MCSKDLRAFGSLYFQKEPLDQPNWNLCSLTEDLLIHDRNVHACCRFRSSIYSLSGGGAYASRSAAVGLPLFLHASHSRSRQSGEITEICNNSPCLWQGSLLEVNQTPWGCESTQHTSGPQQPHSGIVPFTFNHPPTPWGCISWVLNPEKAAPPLGCSPQFYIISIPLGNLSFIQLLHVIVIVNQVPAGTASPPPPPPTALCHTQVNGSSSQFVKHSSITQVNCICSIYYK